MESSVVEKPESGEAASSFTKSLLLGEIHEEMVFPWPEPDAEEQRKVSALNAKAREIGDSIDHRQVEEDRWIGDDNIAKLGEAGLCGLYVDEKYGGQGLSQTGYARVFETFAQIDGTLSIILGVHQSIGYKGIHLFGTEEQKERWLPDLAAGRKLAGFALTEPQAGSDAYHLRSRAVQQPDGSWVLNGEKRYIGNGSKGDVFTAFARAEVDGKDRHIALILEKGMEGFEVGERYDTMGLRGNDLRRLYFNDVRVPKENVLGEPGEGFHIAMSILNNGRIGLGTGSVGAAKKLLDLTIDHVNERQQFGQPLARLRARPGEGRLDGLLPVRPGVHGVSDLRARRRRASRTTRSSRRSARSPGPSSSGTRPTGRMQLRGGEGYMKTDPYEKILRDIRIFPIFEGANDVMRCFIALSAMKPVGEKLSGLGNIGLGDPIGSIGVLADYAAGRVKRQVAPDGISMAHPELEKHADAVSDQVRELSAATEGLIREHKKDVTLKQLHQKRLADAISDVYAQVAVLSRVTAIFEDQGVEPSGQERYIADSFCQRAAGRVRGQLRQMESNDDERMTAIAKLAYRRGEYGYALFAD